MKNYQVCLNLIKWKNKLIFILFLVGLLASSTSNAQENTSDIKPDTSDYSWERFSFKLGGFVTGLNSDIQIRSQQVGLGVLVNVEDALGLSTSSSVIRSEIQYNFGKTRRHSAKLDYFGLFRQAQKVLDTEIEIGDEIYPIGTEVSSKFNLRIFKGTYAYSFYMDERVKIDASLGLFIMPISFSSSALKSSRETASFTAPLPVVGLGTSFAITPKLYLKQSVEVLYLDISNVKGSIVDVNMRLEYNRWKQFGVGFGINAYRLSIESDNADNPFFDFKGNVKTGYSGLLFFGKYYF